MYSSRYQKEDRDGVRQESGEREEQGTETAKRNGHEASYYRKKELIRMHKRKREKEIVSVETHARESATERSRKCADTGSMWRSGRADSRHTTERPNKAIAATIPGRR